MTYAYGERGEEEANIVNGLLTSQTYGNGDKVSFTYDDLGRNKTTTYSDGRVLTYAYTGDGQLYSIHDSKTQYTYVYTYDSIGRLIASCVKSGGTVLMQTRQEYNANNRMTAQHWTMGDTTYSQTFSYNKQEGMLTAMTTGNGHSIQLEYDALRRLSSVSGGVYERKYTYKDTSNTNTTPLVSGYHYKNSDGEVVYSFGYTYDVLGNIASHTDATGTLTYTYDAQNQLTRVRKNGSTLYEYTYDNAGNILTASNGTTTHTYSYDNGVWRDLLTSYDGQRILYEGENFNGSNVEGKPTSGNPVSYYNGTRWTFDWQEGRNLVSAAAGSNTYEYAYDSNGLRVSKEENGKTHTYLYASGKLLRETISENNVVIDVLDFFYDHSGYPCELNHTTNGTTTTYYYITNLQGDVLYLLDSGKNVVASYSYDPYGKPLDTPDEDTIEGINPLRYRGYYYDLETGFYYLQSRYYDPSICRFINADSYTSTGQEIIGYNMLTYCNNNPINHVDNQGMSPDWQPWDDFFEDLGWWLRDLCVDGHYSRNENNQQPSEDELMDIVTGNSSYWLPVDDKYNKYHRFTEGEQGQEAIYNKKYMSPDGKHEVIICYDEIYVPDPYIVTDPINLGTYNYGANKIIHFFVDMIPYWLWGNSPSDTTTDWDRIVGRDYS